jgi:putative hydrolase of HD superfamily
MTLKDIIKFSTLLTKLQNTKRVIYVCNENRLENDVEHSYMLAMLAWYFVESDHLDLDVAKIIQYAMVHDLVEVYAGDVYLYETNQTIRNNKHKKERQAAARIKREFPKFQQLHTLIQAYEGKVDAESKFVYALDKVQPVIQIYLDRGRTWNKKKITLKMLIDAKKDKVALSKPVQHAFDELVSFLKHREKKLFKFKYHDPRTRS